MKNDNKKRSSLGKAAVPLGGSLAENEQGNLMDMVFERLKSITGVSTDTGLAKALGIAQSSVAGARSRNKVPPEWIMTIGEKYNISALWIATGRGPKFLPSIEKSGQDYGQMAEVRLASPKLSAGGGIYVGDDGYSDEIYYFRSSWLRKVATSVENCVLFNVVGESMYPTLYAGDLVLIDRGATVILGGMIYAIREGDTLQVKRLAWVGQQVRVISDNKDVYPYYDLPPNELIVHGRVIWYARTLQR